MQPIYNRQLRILVNLDALNAANAAVGSADEVTWEEFLRDHEEEARALRTGLWTVGHMKCWFSEVMIQQGEGEIEHFRPKGRLSGAEHAGYKWRTFDWNNLRFAHPTVNKRRTDYLSRKKMGKGSYFPLQNPEDRANNAAEEINETPLLLDPIIPSDTREICFDEASGAPKPRHDKNQNAWLYLRAEQSIDYYHLDEGRWNAKRADLMAAVRVLCKQLDDIIKVVPRDEDAYNRKIDEILAFVGPYAEFSSACLQVVCGLEMYEYVFPPPPPQQDPQ